MSAIANSFCGVQVVIEGGENPEDEISKKYGIAKEDFCLYEVDGMYFFVLSTARERSPQKILDIPERLKEMGCVQERFNYHYGATKDVVETERGMLPYCYEPETVLVFPGIAPEKLSDPKALVDELEAEEKQVIAQNIDSYVCSFLKKMFE